MKKLIAQTILFLLLALAAVIFLYSWSLNFVKKRYTLQARSDIHTIITGHSHPEYAFNDSLIRGVQNFSKSGESYFYTYYKLKPLLEQNPQIKTVWIEFSNDVIISEKDEWTWGKKHMSYLYPDYGIFIDKEGNKLLRQQNLKSYINNQSRLLKSNVFTIINKTYDFTPRIGKYLSLHRNQVDSLLGAEELEYIDSSMLFDLSEISLEYLQKVIDLCRAKEVEIFLVRSPLHPASAYLKNEKLFKEIYQSRFKNVEFVDFSSFPLTNEEYGNLEHLNYKGAWKFSNFVNDLFEKGLMEMENKQEIIDEEIRKSLGK